MDVTSQQQQLKIKESNPTTTKTKTQAAFVLVSQQYHPQLLETELLTELSLNHGNH